MQELEKIKTLVQELEDKIAELEIENRVLRTAIHQACNSLMRQNEEMGGAWYSCNAQTGWLCPATLKFFDDFPESIYFKLEKL